MDEERFDPHVPLREDVRRLGELLGRVLSEQGGQELLETVEKIRILSKTDRVDPGADSQLSTSLSVPIEDEIDLDTVCIDDSRSEKLGRLPGPGGVEGGGSGQCDIGSFLRMGVGKRKVQKQRGDAHQSTYHFVPLD